MMFVTGNSKTVSNELNVGPAFAAYPNWSKGNRNAAWVKVYNSDYNGFAAKNDYFFAGFSYTLNDCGIDVFKTSDGSKVGTFGTQQLDEFGWIDIPWGLIAEQRANGEYLVFREDDYVAKTVIQRWNPYSKDDEKPTKPSSIRLISKTSTSATISFDRSSDKTGLSGYFIYANGAKNNILTVWDSVYTITGLKSNTDYSISAAAADYANNETHSDILQVKTFETDITKPDKPDGVVASNINYTSFTLNWNPANDNIGTAGYDIFVNNQKIGYKLISGTSYNFKELETATQYNIQIIAYDYAGNASDISDVFTINTLADSQAPSIPAISTTGIKTSSEVAVTWTTSIDNVGVEYYNIYQNENLLQDSISAHVYLGIPLSAENNYFNYRITGLLPDSTYNISVRGFDKTGNGSGFSNSITVKTESGWSKLMEIEEADMSNIWHQFYTNADFNTNISGFISGQMKEPGYIDWHINVPTDTLYRFITHYGSMEDFPFNMQIDVNGVKKVEFTLKKLPSMTSWAVYEDDPGFLAIRLKAGENHIRLHSFSQFAPNIDFVKILRIKAIVPVEAILLDSLTQKFSVTDKIELKPKFTPANASNKGLIWKTSRNSIVNVSDFGVITANRIGTAIITATTIDGGFSDSITVTVSPSPWRNIDDTTTGWIWSNFSNDPCSSCFNETAHSTNVIDAYAQYTFTGTDVEAFCETWDGGGDVEIFIDNVSKGVFLQNIKPYGGGQKFAAINNLPNVEHVIKFVSKTASWSGIDYIRYILPVSGVTVTPATISVEKGKYKLLTANILPSLASIRLITWFSSDTLIAKVNATGEVTGISAGLALITAKTYDGGFTAHCVVNVSNLVGISSDKLSTEVFTYPNPASNELYIAFNNATLNHNIIIKVYNAFSELVLNIDKQEVEQGGTLKLSTASLANGIYLLKITRGNEQVVKKVIITD